MKRSNHRITTGRLTWIAAAMAAVCVAASTQDKAGAQSVHETSDGRMLMFESYGASKLVEKVRSDAQGVVVAIHVSRGEFVRKGQVLGSMDLDATKFQLDLARHTMLSKGNVESAKNQADAWKVARQETEQAVRRRKVEETRLDWALAMEKMYQANYEVQLDAEITQQIQFEYWKDQFDKRFFRSPVDGVVSEVIAEIGKQVGIAAHVFTVSGEGTFSVPVNVPSDLAESAVAEKTLPVRSVDGQSVSRALVDKVIDDPREAGRKIVRLLIKAADFPAATRPKLSGMKFDVLLPQVARESIN